MNENKKEQVTATSILYEKLYEVVESMKEAEISDKKRYFEQIQNISKAIEAVDNAGWIRHKLSLEHPKPIHEII